MSVRVERAAFKRSHLACGWTGVYDTRAKADYAKKRHSCARWLAKAESAARREERMAQVDRTPKPCLHKRAQHVHGSRACYVLDRCRCTPCSQANAAAETQRERQKAYGRYDKYVDAQPVRDHLAALQAYGIGLKKVSTLSGVSNGSLTKIWFGTYAPTGTGKSAGRYGAGDKVRGPAKRVLRTTADRILAVKAIPANLGPYQPDHERTALARLHMRSLVALGWSQSEVGRRMGMQPSNLTRTIHGDQPMHRETVDRAEAVFADLSMTPPPERTHRERLVASRARNYARRNGWVPPLELEDVAPHDEVVEEGIDEAVVVRLVDGDHTVTATHAERREAVRRLHSQGLLTREIAPILGRTTDGVLDDLKRLGLRPHIEHLGLSDHFTGRGQARRNRLREAS